MWENKHVYRVDKEERKVFSERLLNMFDQRNVDFNINTDSFEPYLCSLEINALSGTKRLHCGSYWYDETNILPIVAMTHELGHLHDLETNFGGVQAHYHRTLGNLNLELRAWFYAVEFCRELGFTRWDVFFQYAKNCLSTYFSDLPYSHRLDRRFGFKGTSPTFEEGLEHLRNVIGVPFEEFKEEDITKEEKSIRDELFELLGW